MTVSVTTRCMNRITSLRWALPSWLACPEVNEVVVVDWSSQVPIHAELRDLTDPRILHVRVEGQTHWYAARCHNVEIAASTSEALLRIDSDVRLHPNFFQQHPLADNVFWNAWWKLDLKQRDLAGTIYTLLKNFRLVNGYNERLMSIGYEDDDLCDRMLAAGIRRMHPRVELLEHLPHDDASRLTHVDPDHREVDLNHCIGHNEWISKKHPWCPSDRQTRWNVTRTNDNLWTYTQEP